jgi:FkbM family methyltransferase
LECAIGLAWHRQARQAASGFMVGTEGRGTTDRMDNTYRTERGLMWPAMDADCAPVIFNQLNSIDVVLKHVTNFSLCMQAGGHCGLWPINLATKFGTVFTCEPHPLNFAALKENVQGFDNIVTFNCAVGDRAESLCMVLDEPEKRNCGAFRIAQGRKGDIIQRRIDDLGLPNCGLIYLDVEGFEEFALRGAEQTIRKYRPVIAIEAKELARYYGKSNASGAQYIKSLGYDEAARIDNDVIYVTART